MRRLGRPMKPFAPVRRAVKRLALDLVARFAETNEARALAANLLRGLLPGRPALPPELKAIRAPYPDLGTAAPVVQPARQAETIFITARFRSGSTLLWNLFRHLDGVTAYYEPFNPRRWFDPRTRGTRIDPTHRNVPDYWREYDGLEQLGAYYRAAWAERNLFMDQAAWDPAMQRYLELMIQRAPGRPVLQFNRIDFRLPWFRRTFPAARIVHLYRHPRDQWCSALLDSAGFPKDATPAEFPPHDKFYLGPWCRDLRHHFPFLDARAVSHPYQSFYYLWKLSFLFGVRYADYSLSFEQLVDDPATQLAGLFRALDVADYDLAGLTSLIVKPAAEKWTAYADDDWFRRHESACETVLADFLGGPPG